MPLKRSLAFYPIPTDEVDQLVKHLQLGPPTERAKEFHIIDPCAGQGVALKMIADALHIPYKNVYAVELDKGRGESVRANLPGANVLAPCSLFSTLISHRTFSLVYVNPPFDNQLGGGGRDETEFVKEAYTLLADNGVVVVVAPLTTFQGHDFRLFVDSHFKDCQLYRFNEPQYGEVVMFGRKRSSPLEESDVYHKGQLVSAYRLSRYGRDYDYARSRYKGVNDLKELPPIGTYALPWKDGSPAVAPPQPHQYVSIRPGLRPPPTKPPIVWDVPPSWKPSRFAKAGYLPEELIEEVNKSPNNDLFRAISDPPIQESPLPLERGHVAVLVTSGALDGLIEVPDFPHLNHVMRGIARKIEQPNEEASKAVLSEDGNSMRVTEVYSETMDTKIRAIDRSHKIYDFELKPVTSTKSREHEVNIEEADGEVGEVVIPLIREGDSDYIEILCGSRMIKFCFDTGATSCHVSSADLKGVEYFATGRTALVSDAAGRTSTCKEIIIAEMTVCGLRAKNVRCLVGEPTEGEIPALLGQNFLRMFDYHYSQSKGTLTLTIAKKEGEPEEA